MARREKRWPIWKIAVAAGGCFAGAAVLLWVSRWAEATAGGPTTNPASPTAAFTFPAFLMMLALMSVILGVLATGWLVFRIREARTPVWKRPRTKGRR